MDSKMIEEILQRIDAGQIQSHSKNIQCCCLMSPYRRAHSYTMAWRPSMGISINPIGLSLVNCLACGYRGTLIATLEDLEEKSGRDLSEVLKMARSFEQLDPDALVRSVKMSEQKEKPEIIVEENALETYPKGYHPNILSRGFELETLKAWDSRWDSEWKRVMFPVRNFKGLLVGAVGRTVVESKVKYFNYFHFDKSKYLFGEHMATRNRPVVLVEGQLDAILLWQYFARNGIDADVVALAGSNPSKRQLQKIVRNWDSVVLFLDNDPVGWDATRRLARLIQHKVLLKAVTYPKIEGSPDEERQLDPAKLIELGFDVKAMYESASLAIVIRRSS